ncbi:hypothetical protein [Burkholderia gladioli]|uniref:hypothetical protein n=1 Tax=Burkholderia gladioli TaxID=28095 RepID=UPI001640DBDF|nr:hypothetical protein [Burkholderia gladioli]
MKERPILFSAPMVRAILEGRKTQTRRVVKHQPPDDVAPITVARYHPTIIDRHGDEAPGDEVFGAYSEDGVWGCKCPYGEPGDRLWVRETWSADFARHYPCDRVWYAADDDRRHDIEVREGVRGIFSPESNLHVPFRWRPSIHMPRAMSRITLEITSVRVERLQDISEADAIAEGIERTSDGFSVDGGRHFHAVRARDSFASLWDSLNEERGLGWEANPWVWAIEFPPFTDVGGGS